MKNQTPTPTHGVPDSFLNNFGQHVTAILAGFDRLRFRATLRLLFVAKGMEAYLNACHVLIKDFKAFAEATTARINAAAYAADRAAGRPALDLPSPEISKEDQARQIARDDHLTEGLIALFSAPEVCLSYAVRGDPKTKQIHLVLETRKCTHLYHYFLHPDFGQVSVRVQTWFPFAVDVCLNGREWLARQMNRAGLTYEQRDNCFGRVSDPVRAQALLDEQLHTDWVSRLQPLLEQAHPLHAELGRPLGQSYYWTASQTEYATDLLFGDPTRLATRYPQFVPHGIRTFGSRDVLRFLGHGAPSRFRGELASTLKHRPEGICLRHRINGNSLKVYDKQGSILRTARYPGRPTAEVVRRQAAAVTRRLRLLRAHGLIKKVSGTHRWLLTERGRRIVTALLAARNADVEQLTQLAA